MKNMKKMLLAVACMALVMGLAIGGTIAYLVANTDSLTNTFTVGDVNITLTETKNDFDFVPGDTIAKDPIVGVTAGSEACYVFIKVTDVNNTVEGLNGKVINWTVDENIWTALDGHAGYWYKEVSAEVAAAGVTYTVFTTGTVGANGQVTVNTDVTKDMVTGLTANKPQIIIDAAAVQSANIANVETAFAQLTGF